ncbi:hypothetical protein FOZ76_21925 [Verticiella sediminum]|uniref:SnoaL-like domain-containing protein n=1 Tax=Verticiella sediminum TaxID=1247510 RepID=A0A556AC58_9BURK|nr:nuclear transport factor 2 family protein [Verticiella sediminum]TSH90474.1 hypothetical protein FOZ76_21925 [Verticiella sediminum]
MSLPTDSRIETVRSYFRKVDAKDPSLLDLFTDDVEFFFPKFGVARGKAAVMAFGSRIAKEAAKLTHDIDGLVFTAQGERIVAEGREWGETADGRPWPDGHVSQGRFANVFESDGPLIKRTFIYVDPDFTGEDRKRVALYRAQDAGATPDDVARRYVERVRDFWAAPHAPQKLAAILDLFAEDVDWDIPGDHARVSWIGPRRGRGQVGAFFRELVVCIEPRRFDVQRIVADADSAVILGELASWVKDTGRLIQTPFAFDLIVKDGRIVRLRMFEDSHAVARAARRPASS